MQKIKKLLQDSRTRMALCILWLTASFVGIEIFMRHYICSELIYPLLFAAVWSVLLTAIILLFPGKTAKVLYGIIYFVFVVYAIIQAGYYQIFENIMWLTDLQYISEGTEFAASIFDFLTKGFYISIVMMIVIGVVGIRLLPGEKRGWKLRGLCAAVVVLCCVGLYFLPKLVFMADNDQWGADQEFRRGTSLEGTYEVMYDSYKVYRICGIYQYTMRDIYKHFIEPNTPAYEEMLEKEREEVDAYFAARGESEDNEMTGIFEGKNVIVVLMESMDDWLIAEETTPNICRMMDEGINFTNMYTPGYGGVRTFNTEFCANTGIYLPTDGNLAFSYCNNDFSQSMPSLFREQGYSSQSFHYNQDIFYNRGIMHPAMGFEDYVSYYDYTDDEYALLSDTYQFENTEIREKFFGGDSDTGKFCSFLITRSAHMPYTYGDELSEYALERYPEYKDKTGHEEVDCMQAKAKLVDDLFAELVNQLEETGHLEDTVIVAFADHYVYGMTDKEKMFEVSGVDNALLLEKTPFFIWSHGGQAITVDKTVNTADILPTVLNLFGMKGEYSYLGQDAFDEDYEGYTIFADGSWLTNGVLYSEGAIVKELFEGAADEADVAKMNEIAADYINVSNLLLKCNYYAEKED